MRFQRFFLRSYSPFLEPNQPLRTLSRPLSHVRLPFTGRPGGNRTPNLRFWRPLLCQLSYWPKLGFLLVRVSDMP
uniref:Uncharacterized protein n=1 Tax=uncultured gamma proteobacterium HF0010_16J05 TaxID=710981 RepID=E0XR35_9GAMM|nr:hypothetical protein [uncultured gamma proteobacterium HF0010_16J05]